MLYSILLKNFTHLKTEMFSGRSVCVGGCHNLPRWGPLFPKTYIFSIGVSTSVMFLKSLNPSMRRDADSPLAKCHFNPLLPSVENICRTDFSTQEVRREMEMSEWDKAVYYQQIFSSLLCTYAERHTPKYEESQSKGIIGFYHQVRQYIYWKLLFSYL